MNREAAEKFVQDQMDGESISLSCAILENNFYFGCYASYRDLLKLSELIILTAEYRRILQGLESSDLEDPETIEQAKKLMDVAYKAGIKEIVNSGTESEVPFCENSHTTH